MFINFIHTELCCCYVDVLLFSCWVWKRLTVVLFSNLTFFLYTLFRFHHSSICYYFALQYTLKLFFCPGSVCMFVSVCIINIHMNVSVVAWVFDGTEFLRFSLCNVFTSRFACWQLENCKKLLFWILFYLFSSLFYTCSYNCFFFFFYVFTCLQLHTETKRSILNHSFI